MSQAISLFRTPRGRYLAMNLAAWVAVLLLGLAILAGARQFGRTIQARIIASEYLAQAEAAFDEGDWMAADRALRQALFADPSGAAYMVDAMGARLAALPEPTARLEARLAEMPTDPETLVALARLEAMRGDVRATMAHLKAAADAGAPEAPFLLGQLHAREGDFHTAWTHFTRYWRRRAEERLERVKQWTAETNETTALSSALALFRVGLWDEALQLAADRSGGPAAPGWLFFQGLRADLAGESELAQARYAALLKVQPGHTLAQARLAWLEPDEQK